MRQIKIFKILLNQWLEKISLKITQLLKAINCKDKVTNARHVKHCLNSVEHFVQTRVRVIFSLKLDPIVLSQTFISTTIVMTMLVWVVHETMAFAVIARNCCYGGSNQSSIFCDRHWCRYPSVVLLYWTETLKPVCSFIALTNHGTSSLLLI